MPLVFLDTCFVQFTLSFFIINRRQHTVVRVLAIWVVEHLDVIEHILPCCVTCEVWPPPDLQLQPNHIRSLKNKQSKRDVPLIDKALDELRPFLAQRKSDDPKAPVFPRYGCDGGMDAVSQLLNGVIRKRLQTDDPTLVSYSTRHTMKDKMRTIRATAELQHSILGHGKRTIADDYGDGEPLRHLLEVLIQATTVSHWGS